MFSPGSRYFDLEPLTLSVLEPGGAVRQIRYAPRRLIASAEGLATVAEHTITQGDRLDNITARYAGDPTLFWRLCDANNVLRPEELTGRIGRRIRIALVQP